MIAVSPHEWCKLYCRVHGTSAYYPLKDKVVDGTPCGPDTYDMCVNGICKPAGCNHMLGSSMQLGKLCLLWLSLLLNG
jgi:thrombospondin motif-containing protein 9